MQLKLFDMPRKGQAVQSLANGQFHHWYRFVLAYPDHLVGGLLDRFRPRAGQIVLDPFCGTGTTVVECLKRDVQCIGIDANPICAFATRVKTNWNLQPSKFRLLANKILSAAQDADRLLRRDGERARKIIEKSAIGQEFERSGMVDRGWISQIPLAKTLLVREAICEHIPEPEYRDLFLLALASVLVSDVANVRFGPEIYCVKPKPEVLVSEAYARKLDKIHLDLRSLSHSTKYVRPLVVEGDSRVCDELLRREGCERIDYVITSPPYPTEHDYTRNTRLELVFLGFLSDRQTLRKIKKQMIRSHSKGIYVSDRDGASVADIAEVKQVADELRQKVKHKTYGFAKLYPRIVEEYFGGMYRHLRSLSKVLKPGAMCAYVVGDQKTYLQTYTPTAEILAKIVRQREIGLQTVAIETWRKRRGTTGSQTPIEEKILLMQKS